MQSLDSVFFFFSKTCFLAFSSSLLALFSFLVCDNFFLSFSSFKSSVWSSVMHLYNYILVLWISEWQVIKIESVISWLINFKYSSQPANFTHLILWFCYTSGRYTADNFQIIYINTKVRGIFRSTFVSTFIWLIMRYL